MDLVLQLGTQGGAPSDPPVIPGGGTVKAGWRIKNTGSCIWDTAYSIYFSAPDNPEWTALTPPTRLERALKPGDTLDLWVEAAAPPASGLQTASWELRNGRGERVGEPLTLTVQTAGLPTETAVNMRWFRANPESIQPGDRAALSWNIPDAKAIYLLGPNLPINRMPVEPVASRYVNPNRTSKYQLEIVYGDDHIEKISVTIEVEAFLTPRIRLFDVSVAPSSDECAQIEWATENRVNRVLIYRNGEVIWDGLIDDGVIRDCPPPGRVVYVIQVFGPGGSTTKTRTIDLP